MPHDRIFTPIADFFMQFNWDDLSHKRLIHEKPAFFMELDRKDSSQPLVILDEMHKDSGWKNFLKGAYDEFSGAYKFLVCGSGRLDVYQKGGDSLAGRYFHLHLFPLTIAELSRQRRAFKEFARDPLADFDLNDQAVTAGQCPKTPLWTPIGTTRRCRSLSIFHS